jgi:ribosomal protein L24
LRRPQTRNIAPRTKEEQGQQKTMESPIHHSNVMHYSTSQQVRAARPRRVCLLCLWACRASRARVACARRADPPTVLAHIRRATRHTSRLLTTSHMHTCAHTRTHMHAHTHTQVASRVGIKVVEGRKVRFLKKTGEELPEKAFQLAKAAAAADSSSSGDASSGDSSSTGSSQPPADGDGSSA